jgi:hypothetical protein
MPSLRPSTQPQFSENSQPHWSAWGMLKARIKASWRHRRNRPYPSLMVPYYVFWLSLRFAPGAFRDEFGRALLDDFTVAMEEGYEEGGLIALLRLIPVNLWSMLRVSLSLQLRLILAPIKQALINVGLWLIRPCAVFLATFLHLGSGLWLGLRGYIASMPTMVSIRKRTTNAR